YVDPGAVCPGHRWFGADAAWQGRRYGRCVWLGRFGQLVRRERFVELLVEVDRRCRRHLLCLDLGAGLPELRPPCRDQFARRSGSCTNCSGGFASSSSSFANSSGAKIIAAFGMPLLKIAGKLPAILKINPARIDLL